jgi:hypothetical protein
MSRGILAGVAVVLVSAATAVITTMSLRPGIWGATATANVAREIFPAGPAEQMLWPTDRAWVFSVRLGGAGPKSGVRAAVRTAELGANEGYAYGQVARGAPEKNGPSMNWQTAPDTAIVSIQVFGAGEGPARGDRDRERLIVRLEAGGLGNSVVIAIEGAVTGYGGNGYAEWVNGEIHLMNVFAKSGEVVTRYDVVLSELGNTESGAPADSGGG